MIEPWDVCAGNRTALAADRLYPRVHVEMMARFRRYTDSSMVMLKDLTPYGTRVEGVGALRIDEMVVIALPGCRPSVAFVVWANAHCAGLEFAAPLGEDHFHDLVARYGLPCAGTNTR